MNKTGREIISSICEILDKRDIRTTDSNIIIELSSLDRHELNQLICSGTVDKWEIEKRKIERR